MNPRIRFTKLERALQHLNAARKLLAKTNPENGWKNLGSVIEDVEDECMFQEVEISEGVL